MIDTGYPQELLDAIEKMEVKESFVKLDVLNWDEEFIQEIQGLVTTGSLSIDGNSSLRRTCTFTLVVPEDMDRYEFEKLVGLNKKFRLFIGYKNRLKEFQEYGDILWFKLGVFVFITASLSHSTSGSTISVTARDKMCLLNGQVQGVIPDTVYLHETDTYELIKVFNIIQELVNHYGHESLTNIYINDIPEYGRLLMQYNGSMPIYISNNNLYFGEPTDTNVRTFTAGEIIGYKITELTYPGELITKPGDTVTSCLDKIVSMLGNYEYFYDIDGHFIFQEIKNYIYSQYTPIQELTDGSYEARFDLTEISYSFKGRPLISSYQNSPKWDNIKNDFVVWGTRKTAYGSEIPIRYHLAIDDKPVSETNPDLDYREVLYQQDSQSYGEQGTNQSMASYYYQEMHTEYTDGETEWEHLYKDGDWTNTVKNDPSSLNYFLEFIDGQGKYSQFSVKNIGRRTYATTDKDVTCIYHNPTPAIIYLNQEEAKTEIDNNGTTLYDWLHDQGLTCVIISDQFESSLTVSSQGKSCYEVIQALFFQKVSLQESITINSIPIYYLEPNDKIEVEDAKSNIFGEYSISKITIPFAHNGQMNISATRAQKRAE